MKVNIEVCEMRYKFFWGAWERGWEWVHRPSSNINELGRWKDDIFKIGNWIPKVAGNG